MSDFTPGTFLTRNTLTGKLQRLTQDQINAGPWRDYTEIVPDDAKPYEPGMFKPGKVGEFRNEEPTPDAIAVAEEQYEAVLETNAPNSKVARQAKADLAAAQEQHEAEVEAVKAVAETTTKGDS